MLDCSYLLQTAGCWHSCLITYAHNVCRVRQRPTLSQIFRRAPSWQDTHTYLLFFSSCLVKMVDCTRTSYSRGAVSCIQRREKSSLARTIHSTQCSCLFGIICSPRSPHHLRSTPQSFAEEAGSLASVHRATYGSTGERRPPPWYNASTFTLLLQQHYTTHRSSCERCAYSLAGSRP